MSRLMLTMEIFAGQGLEETVCELAETAARLGVWCKAHINGIEVMAAPNDRPATLWNCYQKAQERDASFVSTCVIPRGRKDASQ